MRGPMRALLAVCGEDASPNRSDGGRAAATSGAVRAREVPTHRKPATGSPPAIGSTAPNKKRPPHKDLGGGRQESNRKEGVESGSDADPEAMLGLGLG